VIGRVRLDGGSVASPSSKTEAMEDGSDTSADRPLLNALVNMPAGASWVNTHDGGGAGVGRSLHAGMVCVGDGSDLAGEKFGCVSPSGPGMRIIRHADAGYGRTVAIPAKRGARADARRR
jgi:urocanate hydratase